MGLVTDVTPRESTGKRKYAFTSFYKISLGAQGNLIRDKLPLLTVGGQSEPIEVQESAVNVKVIQRSPRRMKYNVLLGPELCQDTDTKEFH